jgi:hypothetical protein
MLRIDRDQKTFARLIPRALTEAGFFERSVQHMILQSPEAFFGEMGEALKLIGEEIRPDEFVGAISASPEADVALPPLENAPVDRRTRLCHDPAWT